MIAAGEVEREKRELDVSKNCCETTKSEMKKETAHSPVAAIFALFCLSLQLEGRDFFCSYKQTQILPRQAHTHFVLSTVNTATVRFLGQTVAKVIKG